MEHRKTIIIVAILLVSCNFNNKNNMSKQNDFYSYSKFGHNDRIPLIEPYALISDREGKWIFQSEDMGDKNSINEWPVISIGIMDSTNIVVNAWRMGSNTYKIWLIVNVSDDNAIEFKKEEDYLTYLRTLHGDSVKLFSDFEAIYKEFDKENGTLPPEWVKYQLK